MDSRNHEDHKSKEEISIVDDSQLVVTIEEKTKEKIKEKKNERSPLLSAHSSSRSEKEDDIDYTSFPAVAKKITLTSFKMGASFTFSFVMFIMMALLNYISESEEEIAANSLVSMWINIITVLTIASLFEMSLRASKKIGKLEAAEKRGEDITSLAKIKSSIEKVNKHGLITGLFYTTFAVPPLVFPEYLLRDVLNQDTKVVDYVKGVTRLYAATIPGVILRFTSEQMMFSFGRVDAAMKIGVVTLILGTALATWLGMGGLGMPQFGRSGVVGGFIFESYLTAGLFCLYLNFHKHFHHKDLGQFRFLNFSGYFQKEFSSIIKSLKVGSTFLIAMATELSLPLLVGILSGLIGVREQASMTLAMQYVFFAVIGLAAFGQTCLQEISKLIGKKDYEDAVRLGKIGLLTTIGWMSPIPIALSIYPSILSYTVSNKNENIEEMLKYVVPFMSIGVIFDVIRFNLLQQLRAIGDTNLPTAISVGSILSGMVLAVLMEEFAKDKFGVGGVAASYAAGFLLAAILLYIRYSKQMTVNNIKQIQENKLKIINEKAPSSFSFRKCVGTLFSCVKMKASAGKVDDNKVIEVTINDDVKAQKVVSQLSLPFIQSQVAVKKGSPKEISKRGSINDPMLETNTKKIFK